MINEIFPGFGGFILNDECKCGCSCSPGDPSVDDTTQDTNREGVDL